MRNRAVSLVVGIGVFCTAVAGAPRANADEVSPSDAAAAASAASAASRSERAATPPAAAPNVAVFERDGKRVIVVVVGPDVVAPRVAPTASRSSVWPWVLVAGGAVATTAAGLLEVAAIDQDGQSTSYVLAAGQTGLSKSLSDEYWASASSHHDAAKTDQAIAITLGIVGVVAIAAGLTWAILRDGTPTTAKATSPRFGLTGGTF